MSEAVIGITGASTLAGGVWLLRRWPGRAQLARRIAARCLLYAVGVEAMKAARVQQRGAVEAAAGVVRG